MRVMLVKLLSKLPTSVLIRLLLAERGIMSATSTRYKNRANKKLSENKASYAIHLLLVKLYKDHNLQKPIQKPKFLLEAEADLKAAARCEDWIQKSDELLWQYELLHTSNSK